MASPNSSLNSTLSGDTMCDLCKKHFKGGRGLQIHKSKTKGRCHLSSPKTDFQNRQVPQTSTINIPTPSTSASIQNVSILDGSVGLSSPPHGSPMTPKSHKQNKCEHCDQYFSTPRGVHLHISKSHGDVQRLKISARYGNQDRSEQDLEPPSHPDSQKDEVESLNKNLETYANELSDIINSDACDVTILDDITNKIASTFRNSIDVLPGPKHPATKFYRARKSKQTFKTNDRAYKDSTNPERHSKRDRCKRREKYNHEILQFQYYNRRKKCVQKVMNSGRPTQCQIKPETLFSSFNERWGKSNDCVRENYELGPNENEQVELDSEFSCEVTCDEVLRSIKGISYDSSPGPDGVLIRAIKCLNSAPALAALATCMLKFNVVPSLFREARTILVFKSGEESDPNNWRPISICSVMRRIIERVLDKKLRTYVQFSQHQRGFVNSPGCHINTSIVNAILRYAKKKKCSVYVAFLDIVKAFDCIGFKHIRLTLESAFLPSLLREIIWSLQHSNFTRIESNGSKTLVLYLLRGIFQGAPLSPAIFNLCVDYVLRSLTENEVAKEFGFPLVDNLSPLTALGFADDTSAIGKSRHAVVEVIVMAQTLFQQIGLQINPQKSSVVCVESGCLSEVDLVVTASMVIPATRRGENIKYLGVNFQQEIVLNEKNVIETLRVNLEKLVGCAMLRPDQKVNIVNQYIWPTLVYPLQTAPIHKLKKSFLSDVDLLIRNGVKNILGLPGDIPNAMLYSSRKVKGLGLFRASWEAFIQTYNVCVRLMKCSDPFIPFVRDLVSEMDQCLEILEIPPLHLELIEENMPVFQKQSDTNRMLLQNREFENWCALPVKGKGVSLFEECPKINQMIYDKRGLTVSEWTSSLKMVGSVAPVRVIPGRSQDGSRCRHCDEFETLAHVLGSCAHGNLLITSRHHRIRSLIADALRKKNFTVHEEVHCISDQGSNRRVDILVFDPDTMDGYIIDPTVRLETDKNQPVNVQMEKENIYTPCIPFLLHRYQLKSLKVCGLLIGARGTIPTFFDNFRRDFGLPSRVSEDVALVALKGSSQILHHHLYSAS